MSWLALVCAIAFEVAGTTCLRAASAGMRWMYSLVVVFYVLSYSALSVTLALGMPLGVAYGIWTAAGVALTAVIGRIVFGERFTWVMGLGVVLVMAGVLLVETGAHY
ncbi:DMT family transporter [Corynebacterium cystitidis]|uniref:DMT family transporter n=1 Tax=Corynebacterium cystitidis TaxID=35757 RepID=UPI00211DE242|nr:SMR family transporter [Corynebacterium cystitidis]